MAIDLASREKRSLFASPSSLNALRLSRDGRNLGVISSEGRFPGSCSLLTLPVEGGEPRVVATSFQKGGCGYGTSFNTVHFASCVGSRSSRPASGSPLPFPAPSYE